MFPKYLLIFFYIVIIRNDNLIASILPPDVRIYYSQNKQFSFIVCPRKPRYRKECYGVFKKSTKTLWKKELENNIAPCYAFITSTGKYVITIDEWYQRGFTNNDIVIYDGYTGNILYKLTIDEIFTQKELEQLTTMTFKRIWWNNILPKSCADEQKKVLILQTAIGKKQISLETGKLVDEKEREIELGKNKYEIKINFYDAYEKRLLITPYEYLMNNIRTETERNGTDVIEFIATENTFKKFCREITSHGQKYEYRLLKLEYKDTKQFHTNSFKNATTKKLLDHIKDPDKRIRKYVAKRLKNKKNVDLVIPALILCLGDWDKYVRKTAKKTLITYGKKAKPYLLQNLQNTKINHYIKYNIIEIFAYEEFRDKAIIPLLEKISKDRKEDENIRFIAKKVLKKICAK